MGYMQTNMKVKQYTIRQKPEMLVFLGEPIAEYYRENVGKGEFKSVAAASRLMKFPREILDSALLGDFYDGRSRYVANIQRLYSIYFDNREKMPELVLYAEHNCGVFVKLSTKTDSLEDVRLALKDMCKKIELVQSPYSKGYRDDLAYRSEVDVDTIHNVLHPKHTGFRLTTYLDVLRGMGCLVEFKLSEKMKESNVCESI